LERLKRWNDNMTAIFRHTYPAADPDTVAALREQVRIDVSKAETRRVMREENERDEADRKARIEEGQHLLIAMLARGDLSPNDIDPRALTA